MESGRLFLGRTIETFGTHLFLEQRGRHGKRLARFVGQLRVAPNLAERLENLLLKSGVLALELFDMRGLLGDPIDAVGDLLLRSPQLGLEVLPIGAGRRE